MKALNYGYLLLILALTGCGSEGSAPAESNSPSANNDPSDPAVADNGLADQAKDTSQASAMPGTDTTTSRTYTNTYGGNFCDNGISDLQCWGNIDFHAGNPVQKLFMGLDAICYSFQGYGTGNMDAECYSATLGPITMNPKVVRGSPGSTSVETFMNVIVNAQGQICFKIAEWKGTTIHAIYNVCGSTPTANGGIQ